MEDRFRYWKVLKTRCFRRSVKDLENPYDGYRRDSNPDTCAPKQWRVYTKRKNRKWGKKISYWWFVR